MPHEPARKVSLHFDYLPRPNSLAHGSPVGSGIAFDGLSVMSLDKQDSKIVNSGPEVMTGPTGG